MLNLTPSGIKLTPTGVKINTNLVWTSHNTRDVEFNTIAFAEYINMNSLDMISISTTFSKSKMAAKI